MATLGLIGGTGAHLFPGQESAKRHSPEGPWGEASAPVLSWQHAGHTLMFLSRHGEAGNIPPHRVNYRANLHALKELGAERVVALNAVGGISAEMRPGRLVIPDQLIDYTWGRQHTVHDGTGDSIDFTDFTKPYNEDLRSDILSAGHTLANPPRDGGTYAATQGPRLETAAEIDRLERDGCHLVGMTGMPEAALALEMGLAYASVCIVVNWAAGRSSDTIHAEIHKYLESGIADAAGLLAALLEAL